MAINSTKKLIEIYYQDGRFGYAVDGRCVWYGGGEASAKSTAKRDQRPQDITYRRRWDWQKGPYPGTDCLRIAPGMATVVAHIVLED